jgi:hypothetical protein
LGNSSLLGRGRSAHIVSIPFSKLPFSYTSTLLFVVQEYWENMFAFYTVSHRPRPCGTIASPPTHSPSMETFKVAFTCPFGANQNIAHSSLGH